MTRRLRGDRATQEVEPSSVAWKGVEGCGRAGGKGRGLFLILLRGVHFLIFIMKVKFQDHEGICTFQTALGDRVGQGAWDGRRRSLPLALWEALQTVQGVSFLVAGKIGANRWSTYCHISSAIQ